MQRKIKKKEQTKKILIDVAKEIVCKEGHSAITVRRIADLTGYSYTNLYYYFKDIHTLLWYLRLDMIEDMILEFSEVDFTYDSPVEELIAIFQYYMTYFIERPNIFRFFYYYPFIRPKDDYKYDELELRLSKMWQKSFIKLVNNNLILESDVEIIAKTIIYSIQGRIMLSLSSNGRMTLDEINLELKRIICFLVSERKLRNNSDG